VETGTSSRSPIRGAAPLRSVGGMNTLDNVVAVARMPGRLVPVNVVP
jgi:hypothetical protein